MVAAEFPRARQVVVANSFHVDAVGDTDGHARNFGLLHRDEAVSLAPAYDVGPTSLFVSGKQVGMWVDGQSYLSAITRGHLVRELAHRGARLAGPEHVQVHPPHIPVRALRLLRPVLGRQAPHEVEVRVHLG